MKTCSKCLLALAWCGNYSTDVATWSGHVKSQNVQVHSIIWTHTASCGTQLLTKSVRTPVIAVKPTSEENIGNASILWKKEALPNQQKKFQILSFPQMIKVLIILPTLLIHLTDIFLQSWNVWSELPPPRKLRVTDGHIHPSVLDSLEGTVLTACSEENIVNVGRESNSSGWNNC